MSAKEWKKANSQKQERIWQRSKKTTKKSVLILSIQPKKSISVCE
ncbi:unnamed protein product [Haemonchus placei]|uniref:Uncharacterized protein n=1 Tax=Haemonchus placei TaxID=6290 RepID=A0A0N4X171_HAEPC|nr:unnamed protein product [Haemonchus placei]